MADLAQYYSRYDREHKLPANKLLHGVGIPIIIAGVALAALTLWKVGLALFVAGWVLLFLGHRLEGNHPAFFQGPVYFLVGPLWVGRELRQWLMSQPTHGRKPVRPPSAAPSQASTARPLSLRYQIKHWLLAPPARPAARRRSR